MKHTMLCFVGYFDYLMGNYEPLLEKMAGVYSLPSQEEWECTFPKSLVPADRSKGRTD